MTQQPRWILVGGLGLTVTLGLWHALGVGMSQWGNGVGLPLLALIWGGWWWQQRRSLSLPPRPPVQTYDRAVLEQAWTIVDTQLSQLQTELPATEQPALEHYHTYRQTLTMEIDRQALSLAITGSPKTGKTTLIQCLSAPEGWTGGLAWPHRLAEVSLTDTAALLKCDAIMVLTGGDLTQSELGALLPLAEHPGLLVAVNKRDLYLPDALALVVAQVENHLREYLPQHSIPVVTIASGPGPMKRRKHQADGTWQEDWHPQAPQVTDLAPYLQRFQENAPSLVCATAYRQTQDFKQQLHQHLNQVRRQEALKLIQKAQGIAAIATGVNPIPTLDLLATLAVNGQLVVDLARLYRQPLSLKDGESIAKTLAGLLVKLGLVELSTQVLTPLLKAHHFTYLAGAVLQGLSAAYLTRIAGLAIVASLEQLEPGTQEQTWSDRLTQKLPQLLQTTVQRLQGQDPWPWLSQTLQTVTHS